MHLFDASLGFLGGHGIVGGHIPLADRHGLRHQVPRRRPGRGLLLRRGGRQQRRVPRGAQHGRALEAAGHLHLREQPLRHGHRARAGQRRLRHLRARLLLRHGRRGGGRPGRAGGARARWSARSSGPARTSTRPCSRSAPTASWATRCPTRSTAHYRTREEVEEQRKRDPIAVWSQRLRRGRADGRGRR